MRAIEGMKNACVVLYRYQSESTASFSASFAPFHPEVRHARLRRASKGQSSDKTHPNG